MNWPTKVGLGLIALALAFLGGYFARKPEVVVETKTEIKEVEKIVRQVVKEKTTKPDGTVTERTTRNEQTDTTTKARQAEQAVVPPAVSPYRPDYSIGAKWDRPDPAPGSVEAGYRVMGNAWGVLEYDWRRHEVRAGLRVEF